ncbi:MAG: T9SS type A sorting domain-containing protein [Gemmatimonadaceae bacterium]|nr:T9SS type A sorting domain-containing protein [Gemmatimonadaceae bacterium]
MRSREWPNPTSMILVVGPLVLASLLFLALPPLAQTQDECALPEGVSPFEDPQVTAQQVEDGSAALMDFALGARDQFKLMSEVGGATAYHFGCLIRQEGGPWRSGSTYLVQLTLDGRVFVHSKEMALSGRLLDRRILAGILVSLGVSRGDLTDPASVLNTLLEEPHAPFDLTLLGASGYATAYVRAHRPDPLILLAGFDLDASHVVEEEIDYGDPAITASDVVDRESLKAFVTQAGGYFIEGLRTGGRAAVSKAKVAMRDPNGPWRHGSVYLYVLDLASNLILFHGVNPDRYELRPLVATVRDVVTGELILPQVIEAAQSSPEGGFVEYFFDDPTDDTDSADIPKVGYARQFRGERYNVIIGSGFYGRAPEVVATGPRTEVEVTVRGDAVEGLTVEFASSVSGRLPDYAWSAVTDADGRASVIIPEARSGFFKARVRNPAGETLGQWRSIPLNRNRRQILRLTLGGGARVVRSEPLASAKQVAPARGLAPGAPNPFNSSTQIAYRLSSAGPVELVIYNMAGQPVRTLVDRFQGAGSYRVEWDARDQRGASLSSGVYITRLSHAGGVETQRLLYLK